MSQADTQTQTQTNVKLVEPPMFKVIYINDNQTSMDFVVTSLIDFFDYSSETAERITLDIHENGQAVVAVMPYELAEQKGTEVTTSARSKGYPLQVKVEPEEVS